MNRLIAVDLGGAEFVGALLRAWEQGDAVLPIDRRLPAPARRSLLASMRPAAIIDATGTTELPDALPVIDGDALVMATSGTTGEPKGVVLTLEALNASATIVHRHLRVEPSNDKWYACLPLAHIGGCSVVTRALLTATPVSVADTVSAEGLTAAAAAGHTLVSLVVAALPRVDAPSWRVIVLGGSAMPDRLPPNSMRTYGMTETGSGVVYDGKPLDGVQVRATAAGELEVRTPTLARAYRRGDAGPDGVALPIVDGWFRTGDAGAVDGSGIVSVIGRIGDVIVTGGEKVWPEPVERVLLSHVQVADVAVTGRTDPAWGAAVTAVVVPRDPADPPTLASLRDHVRATLPSYCAPTRLELTAAIARTALGKIRRSEL